MAIGVTNVISVGTGVDATSFSQAGPTSAATLYVMEIEASRGGSTNPPTPTVTFDGRALTQIATLLWITTGTERRQLWIYGFDSLAGASSTWLVDFGVTMTGCSFAVQAVTGSDLANGLTQTFVQSAATAADLTGTSGAITLAAPGSSDNRPLEVFCHQANEESTVEGGWTVLTNLAHNNPSSGMKLAWNATTFDTSVATSWTTSSPYGGLATEIKVAGAGGVAVSDPFGMSGFFGG